MQLSELLTKSPITIQCHDHPDADSIAAGYALYTYLKYKDCNVRLIYSGNYEIQKTNLVTLISSLKIPIEYVNESYTKGLLITIDCQYSAGNVSLIEADDIAIIDHHEVEVTSIPKSRICSSLGSCSTLIWTMLLEENFDLSSFPNVSTALYYGLFADTNSFSTLYHPKDRDMRDSLVFDDFIIRQLKNSNISLAELRLVGNALNNYIFNPEYNFIIVRPNQCDPNILGVINDIVLQVNTVSICIAYTEYEDTIKLSLRSCIKEISASKLAIHLTADLGSGGGHAEKAGGFIKCSLLKEHFGHKSIDTLLLDRLNSFFESSTLAKI